MRIFRFLFDPWTLAGMLIVAFSLLVTTLFMFLGLRGNTGESGIPTAALTVIAAPTLTSTSLVTDNQFATSGTTTSTPQEDGLLPAEDDQIAVGMIVQVSGTGGDGLRFRDAPGLDEKVKFLGLEAEVFQVVDGPQDVSGFTWWYLAALYDESIQGWAVGNYLKVIQNP